MPLWFVIVVFVALFVLQLGFMAMFLWLGSRWRKLPDVSLRRAMTTTLALAALNIAVLVATVWLEEELPANPDRLVAAVALMVFGIGIDLLIIKRGLRVRLGTAGLIGLLITVGGGATGYGLAYAIRASLAEAFMTPTNSMAPTILGLHSDIICTNCGFSYSIGQREYGEYDMRPTACPNCGFHNPVDFGSRTMQGDRFLVDKVVAPRRWDLVVHRAPNDPQTLFVKRLVGLPGETIALRGGHVFVDGKLVQRDLSTAVDLWRSTHDTRFNAHQTPVGTPHWEPGAGSGWRQTRTGWMCDVPDGNGGELRLNGEMVDRLPYNQLIQLIGSPAKPQPIGDVKLDCTIESFSGAGNLLIQWEYDKQKAIATVVPDGKIKLQTTAAASGDRASDLSNVEGSLAPIQWPSQILTFAVRDGRAYVGQKNSVLLSLPVGPQTLVDQSDEPPESGCRMTLSVARGKLALSRILLCQQIGFQSAKEMGADRGGVKVAAPEIKLESGEFFVLGDNTEFSRDSRFYGPIKRAAITAVARWIYWPIGRWHEFQ